MNSWLPYLVVVVSGAAVGMAEVIATFSPVPRDAFRTLWAWILVGVNAVLAAGSLAVVRFYTPDANPLLLAIAVGTGLPTLIRTRFTVARQYTGGEDLSINVGWVYDQFLGWFKTEIDIAIVNDRQKIISRLIQKIPEVDKLKEIAHAVIQERSLFTLEEVERQTKYVDGIVAINIPDTAQRVALAKFIWNMGGRDYIKSLIKG